MIPQKFGFNTTIIYDPYQKNECHWVLVSKFFIRGITTWLLGHILFLQITKSQRCNMLFKMSYQQLINPQLYILKKFLLMWSILYIIYQHIFSNHNQRFNQILNLRMIPVELLKYLNNKKFYISKKVLIIGKIMVVSF